MPAAANTRRCILTGERADPALLVRLALSPDGEVLPDVRARAPGRGAWIAVDRSALAAAIASGKLKGALARAFKTGPILVPDDLAERVEKALERAALDRLGLEARGGTLVTGAERIAEAARAGRLHLLLHAADARADGNRKLDQAWRVGRDAEGSGEAGLAIAADRTILSLALGRENVVHIGVCDRAAADRVLVALDRWQRFIGFLSSGQPCESASQGSTPACGADGGDADHGRS
nr:DUF448 domain-containing protein [Sphingomonas jejuensis]